MAKFTSAQNFANNWQSGVQNAGSKYQTGINSVQTSPGQLAAAQKQVYLQNVTASADKWANAVASVSLQDWKTQTLQYGAPKYTAGAAKGKGKMTNFGQQLQSFLPGAMSSLPPRGDSGSNQARYQAMQQAWTQFKSARRSL